MKNFWVLQQLLIAATVFKPLAIFKPYDIVERKLKGATDTLVSITAQVLTVDFNDSCITGQPSLAIQISVSTNKKDNLDMLWH